MTDDLDKLIREIQTSSEMTAELRNQLHGVISTHPWGRGKPMSQRLAEAHFAVAQARFVPSPLRYRLERMTA